MKPAKVRRTKWSGCTVATVQRRPNCLVDLARTRQLGGLFDCLAVAGVHVVSCYVAEFVSFPVSISYGLPWSPWSNDC